MFLVDSSEILFHFVVRICQIETVESELSSIFQQQVGNRFVFWAVRCFGYEHILPGSKDVEPMNMATWSRKFVGIRDQAVIWYIAVYSVYMLRTDRLLGFAMFWEWQQFKHSYAISWLC